MKYLVICPCGHSMDRHEQDGCGGDGWPCECVHTQEGALDAATRQARLHPWSPAGTDSAA